MSTVTLPAHLTQDIIDSHTPATTKMEIKEHGTGAPGMDAKHSMTTTMVAVNPIKMSSGDLSVSAPMEEPDRQFTSQPPWMPHTDTTSTTPTPPTTAETTTPPATTHTYKPDKSPYSKYPLPPRQKNHIWLIFNNTNSLQTESLAELTAKIKQYQSYEPTVLGHIKTIEIGHI